MIRAEGVSQRYGSREVLRAIDVEIDTAGVYGLIGANGAGKTTLLRILQGRLRPTAGRATLWGRDASSLPRDRRARVGVQLDHGGLPPLLRVFEAVDWVASLYPGSRPVGALLEELGLHEERREMVRDLSTGTRRRVAFAAALVGSPELLFLDEPCLGLDPVARERVWRLVRAEASRGATIVLSTNAMDEAETLCDGVTVLEKGGVVDRGPPAVLMERCGSPDRIEFETLLPPPLLDALSKTIGVVEVRRGSTGHLLLTREPMATMGALGRISGLPAFRWVPARLAGVLVGSTPDDRGAS